MDLRNAKGETWMALGGERSLPLFKESEIKIASAVAKTLSGLTIEEAKSILERVSRSLDQLITIPGNEEPEPRLPIDQDREALNEIARSIQGKLPLLEI